MRPLLPGVGHGEDEGNDGDTVADDKARMGRGVSVRGALGGASSAAPTAVGCRRVELGLVSSFLVQQYSLL
jgi:hypothetical protein